MSLLDCGHCQPPPPGCPRAVYQLMVQCWYVDIATHLGINTCHISWYTWQQNGGNSLNMDLTQACQLSRFYHESHDFSASHSLTATQANLTGSPLCCVNIYKCCFNGASDVDFLPPWTKNTVRDWEQSCQILLIYQTKPNCVSEG